MNSYDSRLSQNIVKVIDDAISQEQAAITNGALPDYAAYRAKCGLLNGLRSAREIVQEQESKLANNQHGDKK